jgi:hypothetical protein
MRYGAAYFEKDSDAKIHKEKKKGKRNGDNYVTLRKNSLVNAENFRHFIRYK